MSETSTPLIYNPDLVSREALVRSFVVREEILDEVLRDLRRRGDSRQHHLFIGQRGMGKSTLLHRIAYAIDADPKLTARWTPLLYPEEQYNLRRLSDLLANTVDALAERLESLGHDREASALDDAAQAAPTDESSRREHFLGLLRSYASTSKTRLVLLVDNLDAALDRLGDRGDWALREVLSTEPWILLLGAGTSMHESTWSHGRAFYDYFRVHELAGLDFDETRRLLGRLAEMHDATQVREALEKTPGKIRALHRLTGGNPRTLSLLFNVLRRSGLGDINKDLAALLDLCTPLYKHRLESLPNSQQRIVDALSLHWAPMTAGELAASLGEPVNDVSSQLSRLVRDGVVETLTLSDTTKAGHQIAERFFNVWYLMRAGRRLRKQLEWLVHFLREFYEATELGLLVRDEVARKRTGEDPTHVQLLLACADALGSHAMQHAVRAEAFALARQLESMRKVPGLVGELFDLDGADHDLKTQEERVASIDALRVKLDELQTLPKDLTREQIWAATLAHPIERRSGYLDQSVAYLNGNSELTDYILTVRTLSALMPQALIESIENGHLVSVIDLEGALRRTELTGEKDLIESVVLWRAALRPIESLQDLLHLGRSTPRTWCSWASLFIRGVERSGTPDWDLIQRTMSSLAPRSVIPARVGLDLVWLLNDSDDEALARSAARLAPLVDSIIASWGRREDLVVLRLWTRLATHSLDTIDATAFDDLAFLTSSYPSLARLGFEKPQVEDALADRASTLLMLSVTTQVLEADEASELDASRLASLKAVTAHGLAAHLRAMLDDRDLVGRWRPLAEALDCIARGDTSSLSRLPAEIRGVTVELLATLAPDLPTNAPAKPALRTRTKRRASP